MGLTIEVSQGYIYLVLGFDALMVFQPVVGERRNRQLLFVRFLVAL